jgi:hypothetical protein
MLLGSGDGGIDFKKRNRFRIKERVFERFDGADVGLWRTLPDRTPAAECASAVRLAPTSLPCLKERSSHSS